MDEIDRAYWEYETSELVANCIRVPKSHEDPTGHRNALLEIQYHRERAARFYRRWCVLNRIG